MDLISLEKPQKKGNLPYVILDEKKRKKFRVCKRSYFSNIE